MKYQHESIAINYEMVGEGKPVVILHGLGCDLELMRACLEPIFSANPQYKRIYIDLPGMGKSESVMDYASGDKMLEALTGFVNQIVHENFLLMGESYGGYLARGILSNNVDRVDGIMLLCPVVVPERGERKLPRKNVQYHDASFLDTLNASDREAFCDYAVLANEDIYRRYKNEVATELNDASKAFINKLKGSYICSFNIDEKIRNCRFEKPALFICGRQDVCVGYEDAWEIAKDYPRATFSVVDVAGHNLQLEQPELFNALVQNWLLEVLREQR